jgi:class 3 adenylate cyclase
MTTDDDSLADARSAYDRCEWPAAFDAFVRADGAQPLDPGDLERAALAAVWIGEAEACIELRQRAFAAYTGAGNSRRAAAMAMAVCVDHARFGRMTIAFGWLRRAEKLLEDCEPCPELAQLAELHANVALDVEHDADEALAYSEDALRIATECDDVDLQAAARAAIGTVLVRFGRLDEGMRHIDAAMIDAVSGLLDPITTARVYCATISLCQALGDLRRASEWADQATACAARPGMGDFPGDCRMHRAEITRLRGDWAGAERELHDVMAELQKWSGGHVGQAWYELGEIALRRGELAAAREAFDQAARSGKDPQPGLAMLRLAEGDEAIASALVRAAVANAGDADPLAVGQLLPALVEMQLACGDLAGAAEAADRLAEIARVYPTVVLAARSATSRARVAAASGEDVDAVAAARSAAALWRDAGAPYETAQAQHLLAEAALRTGDRELAMVEVDAALSVFRHLGARRDAEAAGILRDRVGTPAVGRQVRRTFMFTDIVDSTPLVAEMGDERWTVVLRAHDRTIRDLLAQHGGTEVKQRGGGDGFFMVFESAAAGVACAVAIQRALVERRTVEFVPEVRIGVHEADALLSGGDFAGLGVHEAARIGAYAGAGEVLASRATVQAAGVSAATPVMEVELKGLGARVPLQGIVWRASSGEG